MTAILIEANSYTQSVAQGTPTMKGRALITFGNALSSHGTVVQPVAGCESVGFRDETDGVFSAVGFQYQFIHTEQSGSGGMGPGADIYANLESEVGVFINRLGLANYACGELELYSRGNPGGDYEGLALLSGITLETKVGSTQYGGTGDLAITGVGFQPDLVLFSGFGRTYYGEPPIVIGERGGFCFGAADGTNQWVASAQSGGWISGGTRYSEFSDSNVWGTPYGAMVSFVSLDSDGFTLNFPSAISDYVQWIAIRDPDGQFAVGTGTEGDTSITTGFTPEMMLFGNSGTDTLDTLQEGCSAGVGGCDDQLHQYSGFGAGGATVENAKYWNTSAISMSTHTTSVPALNAEASVTAFNATTVDLDWTTGGGAGMLFGWVALSTSVGPGYGRCPFAQQIYRLIKA